MARRLALALLAGALLAACGGGEGPREAVERQRSCDDGGSGGVMIDGVCL